MIVSTPTVFECVIPKVVFLFPRWLENHSFRGYSSTLQNRNLSQ